MIARHKDSSTPLHSDRGPVNLGTNEVTVHSVWTTGRHGTPTVVHGAPTVAPGTLLSTITFPQSKLGYRRDEVIDSQSNVKDGNVEGTLPLTDHTTRQKVYPSGPGLWDGSRGVATSQRAGVIRPITLPTHDNPPTGLCKLSTLVAF